MVYDSLGAIWLSNPSVNRDSISFMIYESPGAVWPANATGTRHSSSLMISESLGAFWAVESMRHPSQQFVCGI
jgi:hypothetical protein